MKKILLFLPNGFEELEAVAFQDVMGWSREGGSEPVAVVTTGLRKAVTSIWGTKYEASLLLPDADATGFDGLAIPGGFEKAGYYEDAFHPDLLELIKTFDLQGKPIAAVCVGALSLAKAGILVNRQATTYDLPANQRRKQLSEFGASVASERIVVERHIITSMGPATALEVALKLLELLTGEDNVRKVKHLMRFPAEG